MALSAEQLATRDKPQSPRPKVTPTHDDARKYTQGLVRRIERRLALRERQGRSTDEVVVAAEVLRFAPPSPLKKAAADMLPRMIWAYKYAPWRKPLPQITRVRARGRRHPAARPQRVVRRTRTANKSPGDDDPAPACRRPPFDLVEVAA